MSYRDANEYYEQLQKETMKREHDREARLSSAEKFGVLKMRFDTNSVESDVDSSDECSSKPIGLSMRMMVLEPLPSGADAGCKCWIVELGKPGGHRYNRKYHLGRASSHMWMDIEWNKIRVVYIYDALIHNKKESGNYTDGFWCLHWFLQYADIVMVGCDTDMPSLVEYLKKDLPKNALYLEEYTTDAEVALKPRVSV